MMMSSRGGYQGYIPRGASMKGGHEREKKREHDVSAHLSRFALCFGDTSYLIVEVFNRCLTEVAELVIVLLAASAVYAAVSAFFPLKEYSSSIYEVLRKIQSRTYE